MEGSSPDFTVNVQGVEGYCPAGERYAQAQLEARTTPVLSCEGPCAHEMPSHARACHAEAFFVPHSAMAAWVKQADRVIMIDGCFLKCHGRVLKEMVNEEKVVHIDALPLYRKYTDLFSMDAVPEEERKDVARQVADKIFTTLKAGA